MVGIPDWQNPIEQKKKSNQNLFNFSIKFMNKKNKLKSSLLVLNQPLVKQTIAIDNRIV